MSLKQVVKYMFKTDPEQINSDIGAYRTLRHVCKFRKKIKDSAYNDVVHLLGTSGCRVLEIVTLDQFGPRWNFVDCDEFSETSPCQNSTCEHARANNSYFTALNRYNTSLEKRRNFWADKFNNVK